MVNPTVRESPLAEKKAPALPFDPNIVALDREAIPNRIIHFSQSKYAATNAAAFSMCTLLAALQSGLYTRLFL